MMDKKKTPVLLVGCGNIGGALLKLWSSFDIFSEIVVVQPSLASAEDFACYNSIKFVNDVKNIRSIAKPTMLEDFLGVYGTQDRSVLDVREDPSTGTTTKRPNRGRLRDDFVPDVVVLAIKPQMAETVIPSLRPYIGEALVISALAGTALDKLAALTAKDSRIVRIMPTVAIKTGRSVNLAFANKNVDVTGIEMVKKIIGLSGEITWVQEENHLDILTPISGSGPAYFFLLAEILVEETVKLGIDEDTARHIIQGTLVGSASLVSDNVDFAALRESVTSKKGVTEAALEIMSSGMRNVMEKSLKAAMQRLEELKK
ncbi:hypothetical protein FACS1894122_00240 [Alphaproteobacteria bacterium]|nr:hypothetical protein FACS1894122_00140 [Alphaproteobacteria bacterium]GHT90323.1 hypothetical protein FACS1894122_00240 [Alphaproteobacteria bacterium]